MSDIPGWAVRGSKVVCVEPDGWRELRNNIVDPDGVMRFPERGETYTIREVRVRFVTEWNELLVGVLLDEVANPIAEGGSSTGEEPGFDIRGFRPVTSRAMERDIEIFRPTLDQVSEPA